MEQKKQTKEEVMEHSFHYYGFQASAFDDSKRELFEQAQKGVYPCENCGRYARGCDAPGCFCWRAWVRFKWKEIREAAVTKYGAKF